MPARITYAYSTQSTYPAAYGLDQCHCLALRDVAMTVAPGWSVEICTDPLGEISLMIIPPNVDDAIGPTLIVHKAGLIFHLDQFRWDAYGGLGEYLDFDALRSAVSSTLLSLPIVRSSAITLH